MRTSPKEVLKKWDLYYPKLVNYFKIYKHSDVPEKWSVDPGLAGWVLKLRKAYTSLTVDKTTLLQALKFTPFLQWQWQTKFAQLKSFIKEHGHAEIPSNDSTLYKWIFQQVKHKDKLPKDRFRKLKSTGVFEGYYDRKRTDWYGHYKELQAFKRRYSHCDIPINWKKNTSLSSWVSRQRQLYKNRKLSISKIELLLNVGFTWSEELKPKLSDQRWEKSFQQLEDYYKKHGHILVSKKSAQHRSLALWIIHQRQEYKKGRMSSLRQEKLKKLGFVWDSKELLWMACYQKLKEFYINTGHTQVNSSERPLYSWVNYLRTNRENLSPEKRNFSRQ